MDIRKSVYMEKGGRHNGTGECNSREEAGQGRPQRPLAWTPITPHMTQYDMRSKQSKCESPQVSIFLLLTSVPPNSSGRHTASDGSRALTSLQNTETKP